MPNWIDNTLHIIGDNIEIQKVLSSIASESESIDFDKIIPMPKRLDLPFRLEVDLVYELLFTIEKEQDFYNYLQKNHKGVLGFSSLTRNSKRKVVELALRYEENVKKHGTSNWYYWRLKNWGTRLNATDSEYEEQTGKIYFRTAWNPPIPVMLELSRKFPFLKFWWKYYELLGSIEPAIHVLQNGEVLETTKLSYKKDIFPERFEAQENSIDREEDRNDLKKGKHNTNLKY